MDVEGVWVVISINYVEKQWNTQRYQLWLEIFQSQP